MLLLLTPPNLLTCARMVLTPWIILALMYRDCREALWLSCVAGFTDGADGFLARRFGWKSRLGAYLDPIADKFLLTSLYICFGITGFVPEWIVWLVVGRDALILLMTGAGLLFTNRREYPPSLWGKISTLVQIVGAFVFLSSCAYPPLLPASVSNATVVAIAATTTWSGVHYVWRAVSWARSSSAVLRNEPS